MCDTKEIFHRSYNPLWFRLSRTEEIFLLSKSLTENISKTLSKYITELDYVDKTFCVLSVESNCVSLCSNATVIGTPVVIAGDSI